MSKSAPVFLALPILLLAGTAARILFTWSNAASVPSLNRAVITSAGGRAQQPAGVSATAEASASSKRFLAPEGVDLDVTYISRVPLYKIYCVEYPEPVDGRPGISRLCPGTEDEKRWPDPGEIVTFTAHVINKGTLISPAFAYAWQIDGVEVASGTLPALPPAAEVTTAHRWPWAHTLSPDGQRVLDDHMVRFTVDPDDAIAETYEINNSLEDRTNALSAQIAIHPTAYAACNVPVTTSLPFSAEDWIQKQIARWNQSLAESIYPATPAEATDRVRVDSIVITTTAPPRDRSHDIPWFLASDDCRPQEGYYTPEEDIDWGLIHEMCHQAGLIDLYTFNIAGGSVDVTDRAGNTVNMGFLWPSVDIMFGGDTWPYNDARFFSSHSAGGSASNKGYRRGYFGEYQFDIPGQNHLLVLDNQGNPAPGVDVRLYQAGDWEDWTRQRPVDATPEIIGSTDTQGRYLLPNRDAHGGVATATGHTLRDNPFGLVNSEGDQNHFLIRLGRGEHEEFHWLDITPFNLAYWLGDTVSHTLTLTSHVPPPDAPAPPKLTAARVEGPRAALSWEASPEPEVVGYRVVRLDPPDAHYVQASDLLTGTHFAEDFAGFGIPWDGHRVYAVTAVDAAGRESGFSAFAYAPLLHAPMAVAVAPDQSRAVLDPWNESPLLRQRPDGIYSHRLTNPGADLFDARYLAVDGSNRLILSDMGFGDPPHPGVRVFGSSVDPLLTFGAAGTGPGQVITPTGVAWWAGGHCTFGGPYEVDDHTLLLLHLDGSYDGAQGEQGTAQGTAFEPGRYGQGVEFDSGDMLTYSTAGNLNRTAGGIEFWLRPDWNGDDGQDHAFFEVGDGWFNRIRLAKDAADNFRFVVWASSSEFGTAHWVGDWQAGEWHHIAATWRDSEIALYEDGVQVGHEPVQVPSLLSELLYVGSGSWDGRVAHGIIDEVRISDLPRVGNSDSCGRFLLADSGSHRIQAFDGSGNFVAEFGSYGSGPGQFDSPQGLAVDGSGRVIVVDGGNSRLVALSFDGQTFGYLDSFTAGFDAPASVAADRLGNLAVADTGNNRIVVLDAEGEFLAEYTEPNDGYTGSFLWPRGVAIDGWGNLVVADTGNQRVVTVRGALPGRPRLWLPLVVRVDR